MSIIATPGLSTSNSYNTIAEADAFIPLYDNNAWNTFTTSQKENWLKLSTHTLENLRYLGKKFYDYQALFFPCIGGLANHEYLSFTGNILLAVTDYSEDIETGDGVTKTFAITDSSLFPTAGTVEVETQCESNIVTLTDESGIGTLTGTGGSGTISYTTGAITLSYDEAPNDDEAITLTGDGYRRDVICDEDLEFDYGEFNDFLKYGAFHVEDGTGARVGISISSNNVEAGTVTLESPLPTLFDTTTESKVLYPIHEDIKKAQLIQVLKIRGEVDVLNGYSVPEGIEAIKSEGAFVRYGSSSASLTAFERKARSKRLHPLALALIGRFTVYGKIAAVRA